MSTRWKNIASIILCGIPLIYYCYALLFWLAASASLGQWAQPSIHDPKSFFFGIPATFGEILVLLSLAVAPFVIVIGYKRRKLLLHVLAYSVCLGIGVLLLSLDLLKITTWIAD